MRLSVVIPYFRAANTIAAQLDALSKQAWPESWEVVISDNESSDALATTARLYQRQLPKLTVVDASDRRGDAHARNVGVEAASGEAIAFCDADDVVGDGWLAAMGRALREHEFVAGRLEFRKLNPPWAQRVFKDHPQQWGLQRESYPPYLWHAGGGTIGIHRSTYESVGGYDESFLVFADKEFSFRVQLAGTPLHFVPDAVIHYRCRTTLRGFFNQARTFAKFDVRLYKQYRAHGTQPNGTWNQYVRRWDHLFRTLLSHVSPETRATWVYQLGWLVGILLGSFQQGILPPF